MGKWKLTEHLSEEIVHFVHVWTAKLAHRDSTFCNGRVKNWTTEHVISPNFFTKYVVHEKSDKMTVENCMFPPSSTLGPDISPAPMLRLGNLSLNFDPLVKKPGVSPGFLRVWCIFGVSVHPVV